MSWPLRQTLNWTSHEICTSFLWSLLLLWLKHCICTREIKESFEAGVLSCNTYHPTSLRVAPCCQEFHATAMCAEGEKKRVKGRSFRDDSPCKNLGVVCLCLRVGRVSEY